MIQIHEYISVYNKWIYNIRGYYDREELSFQIVMDLVYCPGRSSSKRGWNGLKRGMRWIVILATSLTSLEKHENLV